MTTSLSRIVQKEKGFVSLVGQQKACIFLIPSNPLHHHHHVRRRNKLIILLLPYNLYYRFIVIILAVIT